MIKKDNTDRLRRFIKNKHKTQCTGIENEAFQDETETPHLKSSNSLEELTSVSKQETSIGAKKKCVNGLVRSESTNIGGTKKKVVFLLSNGIFSYLVIEKFNNQIDNVLFCGWLVFVFF